MNVHWREGLFLRPHHLQLMQRLTNDTFSRERSLGFSYDHGLIESEVSRDDLTNKILKFNSLRVVMPNGLYVALGENSDISSLNIEQAFSRTHGGFTVYLGVPLYNELRANTHEADQSNADSSKLLYRVNEIALRDENTGENPKPVQLRKINARLLLETDDRTDMEILPLCRIKQATGDEVGLPQLDDSFCPPCLVLSGYPGLNEMLRDLSNQVCSSRDKLSVQIKQGGFNIENMRGIQFEQMMRLRTLNRFGSRLTALAAAPNITPFSVFLELSGLHDELAALQPQKELEAIRSYDHNNPLPVFKKLTDAIRGHLKGSVASTYLELEFVHQDGAFIATLTDEHLNEPNDYYIAITSKEDPQALVRLVQDGDRFKLMAKSLMMRPIRGVKLKEERVPPMEFPASNSMYYFRVLRQEIDRIWSQIEQEKAIAIRWPGMESSDYKITLYMTVPN